MKLHVWPDAPWPERIACKACGVRVAPNVPGFDPAKVYPQCGEADPPAPDFGPGTEFAALAAELGLTIPCGGCKALLADLNRWGPDECERRKPEILKRLRENEKHLEWGARLKAMSKAARKGYGSRKALLDEAISRAREKITNRPAT